jgi:CheY-like chemotaxis protein
VDLWQREAQRSDMARILVCEDDPVFRGLVELALKSRGYDVSCVEDGAEAVRRLHDASFDLLITDIVMPDRDGLELIRSMRDSGIRLPILAVTAGMPDIHGVLQKAAEAMGANEVLLKPIPIPTLLGRVEALLAS